MNGVDEYEILLANYYSAFKTSPQGQMVLKDLESKFYRATFMSRTVDNTNILLNVGAREVIVYILSKIEEFELNQRSRNGG